MSTTTTSEFSLPTETAFALGLCTVMFALLSVTLFVDFSPEPLRRQLAVFTYLAGSVLLYASIRR
jgi:hypothetical protein